MEDNSLDPDDIDAGINSVSGNIVLPATSGLSRELFVKYLIKNLALFSVRFGTTWTDTERNLPSRLDELVVEVDIHGRGQ